MLVLSKQSNSHFNSIRIFISLKINARGIFRSMGKGESVAQLEIEKALGIARAIGADVGFNLHPAFSDSYGKTMRFGFAEFDYVYRHRDEYQPPEVFDYVIEGNCYDLPDYEISKIKDNFMQLAMAHATEDVSVAFDAIRVTRQISVTETVVFN